MNTRLLRGLYRQYGKVLQQKEDLFFRERPFLEEDVSPEIIELEDTKQVEDEIREVLKAIEKAEKAIALARANRPIKVEQKKFI